MDLGVTAILLLCLLLTPSAGVTAQDMMVNPILVPNKQAVCLSGLRAAYYFVPGVDEGSKNWIVYLEGGGWCSTFEDCIRYIPQLHINETAAPKSFSGILSNNPEQNPDFFNWNKVRMRYCDGSSFTGNSQMKHDGTTLYFRGAKIYNSIIKELEKRGLKSAKKALLVGESAGGVATTIHCDRFRNKFSSSAHVKCLSDAAFFFPAKKHNRGHKSALISTFEGLITLHKSTKMLPKSCASQLNPAMCFFTQNVQKYIKTPIFFIMLEFDMFQIAFTVGTMDPYTTCVRYKNCTSNQINVMQDLRLELLDVLPKGNTISSRGLLMVSKYGHGQTATYHWYQPISLQTNETMAKLFGEWYYDKRIVIDTCDHPYGCT